MNSSCIDLQFDIFGFSTMAFKRPNKDTSENQFFVILKMKSYDVFDSRNGFSDLENHTKDTKQTFLAAFYPFYQNLVKIGQNLDQFGIIFKFVRIDSNRCLRCGILGRWVRLWGQFWCRTSGKNVSIFESGNFLKCRLLIKSNFF